MSNLLFSKRICAARAVLASFAVVLATAGAALATCQIDGGNWAGPVFKLGTHFPIPRDKDGNGVEDLYTTNYRVCRHRDNDDLLFVYQQHEGRWHGIGFRRNVGHEAIGGQPGRVQQMIFPWNANKWPETPYVVQLVKQQRGWVIVAMDPIRGGNRSRIVRELTTTKQNGNLVYKYKGTYR